MAQIDLLLTQTEVSHAGQFHTIERTTSLPRPTQKPRPKFYVAATQTEETFAYAGKQGYSLMAIPFGNKIRGFIEVYRDAWRSAGYPGAGEVMIAFHMFCHEDNKAARDIAREPFQSYFGAMGDAARGWTEGQTSKDYRSYDVTIARMKSVTLESQIEAGSAWIGTPGEIKEIIRNLLENTGPFEHASLQINFSSLPFAEAQRSMRLFAHHVMPEFMDDRR
jgi:alkanesulfonate monooxygenase SsuD/methylene tetrahydromethanopterin reductase-like flavin-dependent oxidoreductase (luciferase family)